MWRVTILKKDFSKLGYIPLYKLPFDAGVVLVEFILYFQNLIAIHRTTQHAKCFLNLAKLHEIYYCDLTLAATGMGACSNIYHPQYNSFVGLPKTLSRSPSVGLLRPASFHTGFLGPEAQIVRMANRSRISSTCMFTSRISASYCIGLTGAKLNTLKISCESVPRTFWISSFHWPVRLWYQLGLAHLNTGRTL